MKGWAQGLRQKGQRRVSVSISILTGMFFFQLAFSTPVGNYDNKEIDLLRRDFPGLLKIFDQKLRQTPADFVLAVDVSGSMKPYWKDVQEGLRLFLKAIPDSDYVSIIFFGESARMPYPPAHIRPNNREQMIQAVLRASPGDRRTDLGEMTEKIIDELNRPGGNNLKFVFMFTDFLHSPAKNSSYSRMSRKNWTTLRERYSRQLAGKEVESFALILPLNSKAGRDLNMIRNIFSDMEEIYVDRTTLSQWFKRRKAEILRDRLRYIVRNSMKREVSDIKTALINTGEVTVKFSKPEERLYSSLEINLMTFQNRKGNDYIQWRTPTRPFKIIPDLKGAKIANMEPKQNPWVQKTIELTTLLELKGKLHFRFMQELSRLNLDSVEAFHTKKLLSSSVSVGLFPLWLVFVVGLLILGYLACILWNLLRPLALTGRIVVVEEGKIPKSQNLNYDKIFRIGPENQENINWQIPGVSYIWVLYTKRNLLCLFARRTGVYGRLEKGISAKVKNPGESEFNMLSMGETCLLEKGCTIIIGNITILWQ